MSAEARFVVASNSKGSYSSRGSWPWRAQETLDFEQLTHHKRGNRAPRGLGGLLRAAAPALLASASVAVTASELLEPGRVPKSFAVLAGAAYGLVLRILVHAFPVGPAARPLAGLVLGALPFALCFASTFPRSERLGLGLGLALLGLLVGLLEREK